MEFINRLPVDVLSKIVSYTHGEPEYLNIKYRHSEALNRIQNKYRIKRTEPEIKTSISIRTSRKGQLLKYSISREVPLSIDSVEDILTAEADEIDGLITSYVGDGDFEAKLRIRVGVVAKCLNRHYEEGAYSIMWKYVYDSDEEEYDVDQDNIDFVMDEAVSIMKRDIEDDKDKMEIIGIKAFCFTLRIIEDI